MPFVVNQTGTSVAPALGIEALTEYIQVRVQGPLLWKLIFFENLASGRFQEQGRGYGTKFHRSSK